MRKGSIYIVILAVLATLACKQQSTKSEVKFDADIGKALPHTVISKEDARKICDAYPIFFFIGNGEPVGINIKAAYNGNDNLQSEIKRSAEGLRAALGRLALVCDPQSAAVERQTEYRALLVSITDGPQRPDSTIQTTWFYAGKSSETTRPASQVNDANGTIFTSTWRMDATENWWIDDSGQISRVGDGKRQVFEIHLPTQIESIVQFFLAAKPPVGAAKFKFDQTFYFIKSHGGRFASPLETASTETIFSAIKNKDANETKPKVGAHAFLFDSNGPRGDHLASSLYGASFDKESGCKRFAALAANKFKANAELCGICGQYLKAVSSKGPFARCYGEGGRLKTLEALKAQDLAGLGPEENTTLGPEENTTLGPEENTTLGPEENTTLGPEENTTLGPEENTTLGPEENTTLGPEENTTLGAEENTTLSAGKTVFYTNRPVTDNFDHVYQVAQGVAYSGSTSVEGFTKVTLPLLGNDLHAPMVVLDSCHGDYNIALDSFRFADGANAPTVVVVNPYPMGIGSINYSSLDYFRYLALSYVNQTFYLGDAAKVAKAKVAIDDHLREDGLSSGKSFALADDKKPAKVADEDKTLNIYVIKDGQVFPKEKPKK